MKLTTCDKGHFYDGDQYDHCPLCAGELIQESDPQEKRETPKCVYPNIWEENEPDTEDVLDIREEEVLDLYAGPLIGEEDGLDIDDVFNVRKEEVLLLYAGPPIAEEPPGEEKESLWDSIRRLNRDKRDDGQT